LWEGKDRERDRIWTNVVVRELVICDGALAVVWGDHGFGVVVLSLKFDRVSSGCPGNDSLDCGV